MVDTAVRFIRMAPGGPIRLAVRPGGDCEAAIRTSGAIITDMSQPAGLDDPGDGDGNWISGIQVVQYTGADLAFPYTTGSYLTVTTAGVYHATLSGVSESACTLIVVVQDVLEDATRAGIPRLIPEGVFEMSGDIFIRTTDRVHVFGFDGTVINFTYQVHLVACGVPAPDDIGVG